MRCCSARASNSSATPISAAEQSARSRAAAAAAGARAASMRPRRRRRGARDASSIDARREGRDANARGTSAGSPAREHVAAARDARAALRAARSRAKSSERDGQRHQVVEDAVGERRQPSTTSPGRQRREQHAPCAVSKTPRPAGTWLASPSTCASRYTPSSCAKESSGAAGSSA